MSPAEVIARAVWGKDIGAGTADDVVSCGVPNWQLCLPDADAILAALDAAGLVVVPKEPTRKMIDALNGYAQCVGYIEEGYRAMIAAAKEGE
jgi:hypothetical protein